MDDKKKSGMGSDTIAWRGEEYRRLSPDERLCEGDKVGPVPWGCETWASTDSVGMMPRCVPENTYYRKVEMKEQEMVTIEVPLHWAKACAESPELSRSVTANKVVDACKAALAARKSKYERWREELLLPWRFDGSYEIRDDSDLVCTIGHYNGRTVSQSRLMAAAPQLLDALIAIVHRRDEVALEDADRAIRAALPEDVADEVLGE